MSRPILLEQISRYQARYPGEHACVRRFLQFIEKHADCFERRLATGHITGSAWVVAGQGDRVLLTHHAKLGRWLQLGGHIDGDADVLKGALREAHEESGIQELRPVDTEIFDLDIHVIPARTGRAAHLHYDVRFAFVAGDENCTVSHESNALRWVAISELSRYTDEESMLRMACKWLEQQA